MRKRLLGLSAAGFLGFGAVAYERGASLEHLLERNHELELFMDYEESLRRTKDAYASLSRLEQLRDGPSFVENYNRLLAQRNRLEGTATVQNGLKEREKYVYGALISGGAAGLLLMVGAGILSLNKTKVNE